LFRATEDTTVFEPVHLVLVMAPPKLAVAARRIVDCENFASSLSFGV